MRAPPTTARMAVSTSLMASPLPLITFSTLAAIASNFSWNVWGVSRPVALDLTYLGKWRTPYNAARVTRVGFAGKTRINRHEFGVSWNSPMEGSAQVVGNEVFLTLDVEAILETELKPLLERGPTR